MEESEQKILNDTTEKSGEDIITDALCLRVSQDGNHLVGEEQETVEQRPDIGMLLHNQITGLLPLQLQYIDNRSVYFYSIQGKIPLPELLGQQRADYSLIRRIYGDILEVWQKAPEYFLEECHFVLEVSMLYWNVRRRSLEICYFPGYTVSMEEQLERLSQYLLKKIDHRDKQCVTFLYGMYDQIERGGFQEKDLAVYLKQFENPKKNGKGDKEGSDRTISQEQKYWKPEKEEGADKRRGKREKGNRETEGKGKLIPARRMEDTQWGLRNQSKWRGLPPWIELGQDHVTVGREEGNYFVLPAVQVSRRHAQFDQKQSRIYVTDLHSANGVYLNGKKLGSNHPVLCREEDVISFADISYRLERIRNLPDS